MARIDPHSFTDDAQPRVRSVDWDARVQFSSRTIRATARLFFEASATGPVDLDSRGLAVHWVTDDAGVKLPWSFEETDAVLGDRLRIDLGAPTASILVCYDVGPEASALQWLTPEQTSGKSAPFLFSQCQAIHARSVLPLQDTPSRRITFNATLHVPADLRGLMAAEPVSREENDGVASEMWRMPQPIPPYLFAFAVGRLDARDIGARTRVYAEPEVVDAAAWEFAEVDAMLAAGEKLFGPYDWDRFDILVMPPSFPYGGMENPRLTFVTPTLLAKDRSLANVVAHELAHSWTGNLVTNATAEHFWLNEGFTVYAERRMIEAMEGIEARELHAALGRDTLIKAFEQFDGKPELTCLRTHLHGVDPDEAFSSVPYEKGYLLLRALEEQVGRERFDALLANYIRTFRFGTVTTDDFVKLCETQLPGALNAVGAPAYLNAPGLPPNAPEARSERLARVQAMQGKAPDVEALATFDATEWQLYLENHSRPAAWDGLERLDARFDLTHSENAEILVSWLTLCAASGYAPALPRTWEVLGRIGRMKYLRPLYQALAKEQSTRNEARAAFNRFRAGYHPIAQQVVDALLTKLGAA